MIKKLILMTLCLLIPLTADAKEYNEVELTDEHVKIAESIGYSEESLQYLDIETLQMIKEIVPETVKTNSQTVYQTTTPISRDSGSSTSDLGDKTITLSTFQSGSLYYASLSVNYPNGKFPSNRKEEEVGFTWVNGTAQSGFEGAALYYTSTDAAVIIDKNTKLSNGKKYYPFYGKALTPHTNSGYTDNALFTRVIIPPNNYDTVIPGTITAGQYVIRKSFTVLPTSVCASNYDQNGRTTTMSLAASSTYVYPYIQAIFKMMHNGQLIYLTNYFNRTNLCV